jgi:hypothetical protein
MGSASHRRRCAFFRVWGWIRPASGIGGRCHATGSREGLCVRGGPARAGAIGRRRRGRGIRCTNGIGAARYYCEQKGFLDRIAFSPAVPPDVWYLKALYPLNRIKNMHLPLNRTFSNVWATPEALLARPNKAFGPSPASPILESKQLAYRPITESNTRIHWEFGTDKKNAVYVSIHLLIKKQPCIIHFSYKLNYILGLSPKLSPNKANF